MSDLYQKLQTYLPWNEEEGENLKVFLQFLEAFQDYVWTRDNGVGHITASAWVVNSSRTKVLMAYHKIYDSYAWLGGHADGQKDLLQVALKEALEESGLSEITPLSKDFIDVCALIVKPHVKRGKHIASHLHFNVTYVFEADEEAPLHVKEDENSDVKWLPLEQVLNSVTEEHMKPVYSRLIEKMKNFY